CMPECLAAHPRSGGAGRKHSGSDTGSQESSRDSSHLGKPLGDLCRGRPQGVEIGSGTKCPGAEQGAAAAGREVFCMSGKDEVIIYTDGACSGNPGPGGWGAILISKGMEKEISGGAPATTNNRMEMTAIIEAFRALKRPCRVRLHSDSALIINAFKQGWIHNWQQRGWRKADGKPVENLDLWQQML